MASHYIIFEKKIAQTHHTLTRGYHTPNNPMDEACAIRRTLQQVVECPFAVISLFEVVVRVRD